jgi:uncharacterized protein
MMDVQIESRTGYRHAVDNRAGLFVKQERSKTRLEKRDDKRVIRGYAAVFYNAADQEGTEYWLWSDMVERIMPTAFDRAVKDFHDARALFNHDGNWLLGRVASGTARLSVDAFGLQYEVDEDPNDPQWQSVAAKIDRGDITGSSFAFIARRTIWIETPDYYVREIHDLDLFDVSPVTWPAYSGTTAGRSADNRTRPKAVDDLIRERTAALSIDHRINARLASMGCNLLRGL